MCFSAPASFTASAFLVVGGVVAMRMVRQPHDRQFAAIPFIFAVQQFAEGLVWLALQHDPGSRQVQLPGYIFLVFAQVVWPFWVPFSLWRMEGAGKARWYLLGLTILGAVLALYLAICLGIYGANAKILEHHILYSCDYPIGLGIATQVVYGVVTILPPFFSSVKYVWVLGLALLVSFAASIIFYPLNSTMSVWCYFSALQSLIGILALRNHGVCADARDAAEQRKKAANATT